jgi:hypothetical protein
VATAGAFLIWFRGIAELPVAAPPLLGLAAPVTGATLGWIVLGQDLTPLQLAGFTITIAAITYGATASTRAVSTLRDRPGDRLSCASETVRRDRCSGASAANGTVGCDVEDELSRRTVGHQRVADASARHWNG